MLMDSASLNTAAAEVERAADAANDAAEGLDCDLSNWMDLDFLCALLGGEAEEEPETLPAAPFVSLTVTDGMWSRTVAIYELDGALWYADPESGAWVRAELTPAELTEFLQK